LHLLAEFFEARRAIRTHFVEHCLAAAHRQLGHRVLVGHAAREPQRIGQRIFDARIGPHAHAAA
jgi:hypothetical protein